MPSDKNRSSEVRNGPSSVFVSFRQGSAGAVAVGVGGMGVLVAVGGTGVLVAVGGTGVLVGVVDGSGVLVGVGGGGVLVGVLVGGTGVLVGVLVAVGTMGVLVGVLVGVGGGPSQGPNSSVTFMSLDCAPMRITSVSGNGIPNAT